MASFCQTGLSSNRVCSSSPVNTDHLECLICRQLLWKPVACQTCETPFCSACITRWLANNPDRCPNQCDTYTERKCPPFVAKLLGQLQISCFYQPNGCEEIIPYEALDKHESECASADLTCEECQLVYSRDEAATQHTEIICLRRQLHRLRHEFLGSQREVRKLTSRFNTIGRLNPEFGRVTFKFDDLSNVIGRWQVMPEMYRGLRWSGIFYAHESYMRKKDPKSGYVVAHTGVCGPHTVFFCDEASISVEHTDEPFTFVSVLAAAAWNNDLELAITGYRNAAEIWTHTTKLPFGRLWPVILQWSGVDKIDFRSAGGTSHSASHGEGVHTMLAYMKLNVLN